MTLLQALDRYYERMAMRGETDPPGYTREKISFAIELTETGAPVGVTDLREPRGSGFAPRLMAVPGAEKRSQKILPNLFWDKSSYCLGVTAGTRRRLAEQHDAFKALNAITIGNTRDAGLQALKRFIESWTPALFDAAPFTPEMIDVNIVFRLAGQEGFVHESAVAQDLASQRGEEGANRMCLVTGKPATPQRLHPTIKGIEGALTIGSTLVSFNLAAFASYERQQGENAPVSENAAFRYGVAMNQMLQAPERNRLRRRLGDATVLFWADIQDASRWSTEAENTAAAAEEFFATVFEPPTDETGASKAREFIKLLPDTLSPGALHKVGLATDMKFHIVGLAPNAARLAVRYWMSDDFSVIMRRLGEHYADLTIEPSPWRTMPALEYLLGRSTALGEKVENVQPNLAGEVMRAIFQGARYPRTLLAAVISRLRNGGDPTSGWHAAVIKACLARDIRLPRSDGAIGHDEGAATPPVSLDKESSSTAYQLGRYFAAAEGAHRMALGNRSLVRSGYFAMASAAPAGVFPMLRRGVDNNLKRLRRQRKGFWLAQETSEISGHLPAALPRALNLQQQGLFVLGYYHQRKHQFAGSDANNFEERA